MNEMNQCECFSLVLATVASIYLNALYSTLFYNIDKSNSLFSLRFNFNVQVLFIELGNHRWRRHL